MYDATSALIEPTHESLIGVLSHEKRLLERLVYRQSLLTMLLEAGEQAFVARAIDELEYVESELAETEMVRAAVVQAITTDAESTLTSAIESAPIELSETLNRLGKDLRSLMEETMEHRTKGLRSATFALERTARAVRSVGASSYRADGSGVVGGR